MQINGKGELHIMLKVLSNEIKIHMLPYPFKKTKMLTKTSRVTCANHYTTNTPVDEPVVSVVKTSRPSKFRQHQKMRAVFPCRLTTIFHPPKVESISVARLLDSTLRLCLMNTLVNLTTNH